MKFISATAAMLASAILATFCCLPLFGVLLASIFGSSLAASFLALRPLFLGLTLVGWLAALYVTYKRPAHCCDFEKQTCWENNLKLRKIIFWIFAAIAILVLLYPYFGH